MRPRSRSTNPQLGVAFGAGPKNKRRSVMKQIQLRAIPNFNLCLLSCVISLLLTVTVAAAQQEVDPNHFDTTSSTPQNRTPVSHHKHPKTAQRRRLRKQASATAKLNSQKTNPPVPHSQEVAK
jgi:hypothetical protein